jgi:Predicted chitinase
MRRAAHWATPLARAMARHGITTARRAAHFLAQIGHESASLSRLEENLDYSAARLREVFPSRFDATTARAYARQPERIANRVYANRMGNGDEASGDGWTYRGRGPIQLTGRANYRRMARITGLPLEAQPALAAEIDAGALIAAAWWQDAGLNTLADTGDILDVSRRVNLGTTRTHRMPNGLSDRITRTRRALALLEAA